MSKDNYFEQIYGPLGALPITEDQKYHALLRRYIDARKRCSELEHVLQKCIDILVEHELDTPDMQDVLKTRRPISSAPGILGTRD